MKIMHHIKQEICRPFGYNIPYISQSKGLCIVYGFNFSSSGRVKVEIVDTLQVVATYFTCSVNMNVNCTFSRPIYFNDLYYRITPLDTVLTDGYMTLMYEDPRLSFDQIFTKDLEETIAD